MRNSLTGIYIEDEDEWRDDVKHYIMKYSTSTFDRFISGASLDEIEGDLKVVSGPAVIIMDLRLGKEKPNYQGYLWLLDDLESFVSNNASTTVFVISGQLHEGIRETLIQRGIPPIHIFDKGNWAEERVSFIKALDAAVDNINGIAVENINRGTAGKSIDPYLIHSFRTVGGEENSEVQTQQPGLQYGLPMVVRTKGNSWRYEGIPDLEVLGQIENIYMCLGSVHTLVALERDPVVIDVEASRPGMAPECYVSVPFVKADAINLGISETGDQCLIAFIDSGVDVLHEAFRDNTKLQTRILAIWDQTDPTGPPPPNQKIGRLHTQSQINNYIQTGNVPDKLMPVANDHGTHVVSI